MPVDYSLQLRPTLSHLNIGNASKRGKEDDDDDSDDEPTMRAVEVQVQKRETERQQQVGGSWVSCRCGSGAQTYA